MAREKKSAKAVPLMAKAPVKKAPKPQSIPFRTVQDQWMKDPAFRREIDNPDMGFKVLEALLALRKNMKLTQAQLAQKSGMSQAAIARLESGRARPSLSTLEKIAAATGKQLTIAFAD